MPQTGVRVAFAVLRARSSTPSTPWRSAAGGEDNGGPGLRPVYHEGHYGVFVLDPDGNNVEAACRTPA